MMARRLLGALIKACEKLEKQAHDIGEFKAATAIGCAIADLKNSANYVPPVSSPPTLPTERGGGKDFESANFVRYAKEACHYRETFQFMRKCNHPDNLPDPAGHRACKESTCPLIKMAHAANKGAKD